MSKSTKSTTTNQPPQWLQDQLQSFLSGASGLIGGDPTKLVAPFNPQQEEAFQNISDLAGHQFGQSDIDQYMSPYQQQVIDATQKQLQLADAQQQNSLKGNTISQGALGGDREAVMAAQLAGQQDTANNATIAGLENQGYESALNAYETANQQKMQEYAAQLGAGTLQQQNAQQILDVPYQQYDFLGNLFGDLGGLFGGTSETTQQMPFTIKKGGAVPHMDIGGGVTRNIFMPLGGDPGRGGRAQLSVTPAPVAKPSGGSPISDIAGLNSGLKDLGVKGGISGIPDALGITGAASAAAPAAAAIGADAVAAPAVAAAADASAVGLADLLPMIFLAKNGGKIPRLAKGGGVLGMLGGGIPGLLGMSPKAGLLGLASQLMADGGDVTDEYGDIFPFGATALTPDETPPEWRPSVTNYAQPTAVPAPVVAQETPDEPSWNDGTSVTGKSISDASAPVNQSSGISAAAAPQAGPYGTPEYKPSPWLPIATGVLSALANRSLSKGALAGLSEYQEESHPVVDHSGATVHVRYANGPDFDSGVPTEASINQKAMAMYHGDQLAMRQAAIDAENARAQASRDQALQVHQDSEADRRNQQKLAYINSGLPVPPELQDNAAVAPSGTGDPLAAYASTMQAEENSTGNPAAKNPLSSATGNGQFIDSTWLNMLKSVNPKIASTLTVPQQLALRSDPAFSNEMTIEYAKQNAPLLASAGQPVTSTTLALAHRFGPQGAVAVLKAPPNAPMSSVLPPAVIQANPTLANQTAGQYVQGLVGKFGNTPVAQSAPQDGFIPPKFLSDPVEAEVSDGKGGTRQLLLQQDKRNGQWVTADEHRAPVDASGMRIIPTSAATGGGRYAGQINRVLTAARDASAELGNIARLPLTATTGLFGGRHQGPSLMDATKEVLATEVSSQDTQFTNASMIGLGKALATLESGGMQTNQALLNQFEGYALKEGDTNLTKMYKLALARQGADNALDANIASPLMGKDQKALAIKTKEELAATIPWTPEDVQKLAYSQDPKASLREFAGKSNLGTATTAPASAVTYLKAHPNLRSQFDAKYGAGSAKKVLGGP